MNISVLALEISVAVLALVLLAMDLSMEKDQPRRNLGYLAVCGLTGICRFFLFTEKSNLAACALYESEGGAPAHDDDVTYFFNDLNC